MAAQTNARAHTGAQPPRTRRGVFMMGRASCRAPACVVAVSLAGTASANTFRSGDHLAYSDLAGKTLGVERDVNEAIKVVAQGNELLQVICLSEIRNALDRISDQLLFASVLIMISSQMRQGADEALVNGTLAIHTSHALRQVAGDRQLALSTAASCSRSALVNTYAQKTSALADDAATLLRAANGKVPHPS